MATIFDLSQDDFFFALDELGLAPEQRDELIRQYRSQNSIFGALNRAAEGRQGEIAGEGRRPVAGGLLSKPEGATGMDALRGLRLEPMSGLLGMLTGAGRAIDAPAAAAQGLIPEGDMAGEALGTAGLASLGGAALTRPAGSVGMGGRESDFGQGWQSAYHWTRSPEAFDQFNPDKSTSAMSQLGPHVGTREAAEARAMGFPNETGQMMELRADTRRPFLNPRTNEPWSESGLEAFISKFADEQRIDRRQAAPLMRRMLADEGFTDIPYINDVEDAGSISNIMLVDRPSNVDAVLRRINAAFDPARRTDPNLLAANRDQTVGLLSMAAAAEPRNAAERAAREILDMRAAGRAGEVTDEMMARSDPQYMFDNTPLPMDEASRMARAREMGFNTPSYHSTGADFPAFDREHSIGSQHWFTDDLNSLNAGEVGAQGRGSIIPAQLRQGNPADWGAYDKFGTDELIGRGYDGLRLPERDGTATHVVFDENNIRSRFARFDPEFAHLSNLNAANASPFLGLLAMMAAEEQRNGR